MSAEAGGAGAESDAAPTPDVPDLSGLSASFQNYLKAMWTLQEWNDEPVSPTALAERVGVKLPTASDAVRKLGRLGLVDYERYLSLIHI